MLTLDEGIKAVEFARNIAEEHVKNKKIPAIELDELFNQERGVSYASSSWA
jgi:AMMECR1 domain-containing protein